MRAKRSAFYAVGIAIVLLLLLLFVRHYHEERSESSVAENSPATVSVVPAVRRSITRELSLAGVFQPYQEVDIHGKVSGYIRHIYVDIGDRVKQGQTLAVLEVPELQAQVLGAESGVERSQQEIVRLRNEVSRTEADYGATHANYERLKSASDQRPGLIAAQELDDAQARDGVGAAQVRAAKSAVAAAQQQLGMSQANRQEVSSMAQYATITAPFSGVVTARYADTGSLIPAGTSNSGSTQAVVRLAQSDLLRLRMPVPEEAVPFVTEGSPVLVNVQATGQKFTGTVVRFTRDVSDATRTMMTEVDVPNPQLALSPGMYANTTFTLQKNDDAVVIPVAAVVQGSQPSVWIVDASGHAQQRAVTLGIVSANAQEITSGIAPGDQVIVGGQAALHAGEPVHAEPAKGDLVNYSAPATSGQVDQ
jgi:RND family efflux transporter MFP subunit